VNVSGRINGSGVGIRKSMQLEHGGPVSCGGRLAGLAQQRRASGAFEYALGAQEIGCLASDSELLG